MESVILAVYVVLDGKYVRYVLEDGGYVLVQIPAGCVKSGVLTWYMSVLDMMRVCLVHV